MYEYEYAFPDGAEGIAEGAMAGGAGIVTGILLILYLLMLGVSVAFYVLNAVGMYRIAKRRGIHHPWLAWIPVGSSWLLGSIADHYQYVAKQKVTKRRKVMLTLNIVLLAVTVLVGVCAGLLLAAEFIGGGMAASVLLIALIVIGYLAVLGVSIAATVFIYIAAFDLFRSCRPEHDVLFLVLSIFFGPALFVFLSSGHDKGMPARRNDRPAEQIPYEPEPYAEPAAPAEAEIPVVETEIVEDNE